MDENLELLGQLLGTSILKVFQSKIGTSRRGSAHAGKIQAGKEKRLFAGRGGTGFEEVDVV